jgi:hypothetical protein
MKKYKIFEYLGTFEAIKPHNISEVNPELRWVGLIKSAQTNKSSRPMSRPTYVTVRGLL